MGKWCPFYIIAIAALLGSATALGADPMVLNPEIIKSFLGEAAGNQIAQTGFFFTVAAWLHSGRVKKEIKENFIGLTNAINNVAQSLREDLKSHSERIDNLTVRVRSVEDEIKNKKGV